MEARRQTQCPLQDQDTEMASRHFWSLASDGGRDAHFREFTVSEAIWIWWTQLRYKSSATATYGQGFGWNRDRYFNGICSNESNLFAIWITHSDVNKASGPIH